ncbi:hypothetical protein ACL1I0_14300 [Corynebacterium striatum]
MLQIHEISQRPAVQAVQAVQAELVAAAYPHSTVVLLAELVPLAVKLCQEQPVHLAAPVLEPSVLQVQVAVWRPTRLAVRAELVLALLVLPAALVQLVRRELQVQEELLARMALGERLVLQARRELQEPGVRPERERPEQQPWW